MIFTPIFLDFSKVSRFSHLKYTPLKKRDYLAPTSLSQPPVNHFGSYLVILQPHIPSSFPGVRKVKIVFGTSYRRCAPQWPEKKVEKVENFGVEIFYIAFLESWDLKTSKNAITFFSLLGSPTNPSQIFFHDSVFFWVRTRGAKGL